MSKVIKVTMNKDKTVSVSNQAKMKLKIDDKKITAKMIYDSLDFQKGDTYTVESENKEGKDSAVLEAIVNLYNEIIESINDIEQEDDVI